MNVTLDQNAVSKDELVVNLLGEPDIVKVNGLEIDQTDRVIGEPIENVNANKLRKSQFDDYVVKNHNVRKNLIDKYKTGPTILPKTKSKHSKLERAAQGTLKIDKLFKPKNTKIPKQSNDGSNCEKTVSQGVHVKPVRDEPFEVMTMTDKNHREMIENQIPWGMSYGECEIDCEIVFKEDELLHEDVCIEDECLGEPDKEKLGM